LPTLAKQTAALAQTGRRFSFIKPSLMAGELYAAQGALLHAMLQPFRASEIPRVRCLGCLATQESTKEQRTGINIVGELLYTLRNRAVEAAQRNLLTDNRQYER
jgi:predicted N-acetyltransferase YhbS